MLLKCLNIHQNYYFMYFEFVSSFHAFMSKFMSFYLTVTTNYFKKKKVKYYVLVEFHL